MIYYQLANFILQKKTAILLFVLGLTSNLAIAQINELGIFIGGANYIGDIGLTNYIRPNKPAFGAIYKWNINTRYSLRAGLTYGKIAANDLDTDNSRMERGINFENTVTELSAGIEFNFFDFDLHKERFVSTPYIATGVSAFRYNGLFFDTSGTLENTSAKINYGIPIIAGFKANVSKNIVIAAEIGLRYTFSDGLDGSNPNFSNNNLRFGNLNSDDWYVFSGISITYAFTKKPCFSCF